MWRERRLSGAQEGEGREGLAETREGARGAHVWVEGARLGVQDWVD